MRKKSNGEGSITTTMKNGKPYYTARITIYITDGKQKRKSKSSYKKSEVVKWLQANQQKTYTEKATQPVGKYIEEYLYKIKKPTVKDATFVRYETLYRKYIDKTPLSETPIANVTTDQLQAYLTEILANKSTSIANRVFDIFKLAFKRMIEQGIINYNPTIAVDIKKHVKEKREAFTSTEQEKIMKTLDLESETDRLILLAFASGLRLSELLALTDKDIKNNQINVNKQYARADYIDENKKRITVEKITTPKTKTSKRTVPIPEKIFKIIKPNKKGYVFSSDGGKTPIDRKKPQRRMKELCKKLEIPYRPFHSIRHSYCTRLFESGVSPKTAQTLMGHTDISTTMNIYTHVTENQKIKSVDLLATNFFDKISI